MMVKGFTVADFPSKEEVTQSASLISHTPEKYYDLELQDYEAFIKEIIDILKDLPKEKVQEFLDWASKGYIDRYREMLHFRGRVASPLVVGPSKFPSQEKKIESLRKREDELENFKEKVLKKAKKLAKSGGLSEIEATKKEIEELKHMLEVMKEANKIIRSKKLSKEEKERKLREIGAFEIVGYPFYWPEPDYMGRLGFPSFDLDSVRRKIKQREERLKRLEEKEEHKGEVNVVKETEDYKIVEDYTKDRVLIYFTGIPPEEVRGALKRRGFRWSPHWKAWSRKLTKAAVVDAKEILAKFYKEGEKEKISKEKEPWQMTKKEWLENTYAEQPSRPTWPVVGKKRAVGRWIEENPIVTLPTGEEIRLGHIYKNMKEMIRDAQKVAIEKHKEIIKQALKEGKPVPPEVLKDYPDLVEKYKKEEKLKTKKSYSTGRLWRRFYKDSEEVGFYEIHRNGELVVSMYGFYIPEHEVDYLEIRENEIREHGWDEVCKRLRDYTKEYTDYVCEYLKKDFDEMKKKEVEKMTKVTKREFTVGGVTVIYEKGREPKISLNLKYVEQGEYGIETAHPEPIHVSNVDELIKLLRTKQGVVTIDDKKVRLESSLPCSIGEHLDFYIHILPQEIKGELYYFKFIYSNYFEEKLDIRAIYTTDKLKILIEEEGRKVSIEKYNTEGIYIKGETIKVSKDMDCSEYKKQITSIAKIYVSESEEKTTKVTTWYVGVEGRPVKVIEPNFENIKEGQILIDKSGLKYKIVKIDKTGVPAEWKIDLQCLTNENLKPHLTMYGLERHYKIYVGEGEEKLKKKARQKKRECKVKWLSCLAEGIGAVYQCGVGLIKNGEEIEDKITLVGDIHAMAEGLRGKTSIVDNCYIHDDKIPAGELFLTMYDILNPVTEACDLHGDRTEEIYYNVGEKFDCTITHMPYYGRYSFTMKMDDKVVFEVDANGAKRKWEFDSVDELKKNVNNIIRETKNMVCGKERKISPIILKQLRDYERKFKEGKLDEIGKLYLYYLRKKAGVSK